MKLLSRLLVFVLLVVTLSGETLAQSSGKDLNAAAAKIVRDFESHYKAKVGVSTQVLKSGKVPFTYNGTVPMIPASNLKLVTTAVALDVLGPNYRFETRLYGPATSNNGVVNGDIVLKASGDPTFFPPYVRNSTSPFTTLAQGLKSHGVNKVTGSLIIDDSDFDRQFISSSYHERYLLDSYAAPFGGLGLNRNVVTLSVGPNGVTTDPSTGSLTIVNKTTPGYTNQIWAERKRGTDRIVIHGVADPNSSVQTTITVGDPVRFAGSSFFRILQSIGVHFAGGWKTVEEGKPASTVGMVLLARHRSPQVKELLERTNVESDNVLAQHLFRRLGANVVGYGTVRNSEAVVRDFFKRFDIPAAGFKMDDGSGLSEKNRIAPFQLVNLLQSMWGHKNGQLFIDSLPGPGQGTLRDRLGGTTVRAKTGTLNNHSGISGYVVTAYGQTIGFSILVNDLESTWPAIEFQDELVKLLANWNQEI